MQPTAEPAEVPTEVQRLAQFIASAKFENLSQNAVEQLKIRILDSLGVAIGALNGGPIRRIREMMLEFGGQPLATLIGGGSSSPDRAAFYNGALVRYLDFNDSFLAEGETCHPSDNLSSVIAASEFRNASGKELLTALAVAYQVQIRLSEVAPVRAKGFDHTTQGAYAAAAGAAKALGLDTQKIAHAVAMSGTANNALRVTRTGALSHWKGLAFPHVAFAGTHCAFLAMHGITGPTEVFEGNKGFHESIAGPFEIQWEKEDLEAVCRTSLKKYNAEIHSQSALDGLLELKKKSNFAADEIDRMELQTFQVAYHIIGGGEEGEKMHIRTKEEADHSLPYLMAVAAIDGTVMPPQYDPDRIIKEDVQQLLRRVKVQPDPNLSLRFPKEMPAQIRVFLKNKQMLEIAKSSYEGFYNQPMSWAKAEEKFHSLTSTELDAQQRQSLIQAIARIDQIQVRDFTNLLQSMHFVQVPKVA